MNLTWIKQHSVLVGVVAAFVILLGAVVWFQQSAAAKRAELDTALDEATSQLKHLIETKPAPTQENIDIIKHDRAQVDGLYTQLLARVARARIEIPPDLRPVGFLQLMASTFARLRQAANATGSLKIQDGFPFGFGRYVGTTTTLPARGLNEEETKKTLRQLVVQLRAIEQISQLLIESRVDSIDQIRRSEVEPGSGLESLDTPVHTGPNSLYEVYPFEFQFSCTEDSLRTFLNNISKSDWFFTVRRVQVVGQSVAGETGSTPGGYPVGANFNPAVAAPSSGDNKKGPLSVTARIDLLEFIQKKEPAKKEPATPGAERT